MTTTTTTTALPHLPSATPSGPPDERGPDQLRYWTGALLTAGVTTLVVVLGLVLAALVTGVPALLGPALLGGLLSALAALAAAGLHDAMLLAARRRIVHVAWLVPVATLLAALVIVAVGTGLPSALALAAVSVLTGLVVLCLVPLAADDRAER
jgi:hypothetical protein